MSVYFSTVFHFVNSLRQHRRPCGGEHMARHWKTVLEWFVHGCGELWGVSQDGLPGGSDRRAKPWRGFFWLLWERQIGQWKDVTKASGVEAAAGGPKRGQGSLGHPDAEKELAERHEKKYLRNRAGATWRIIGHRTGLRQFREFSVNPDSSPRFLSWNIEVTKVLQEILSRCIPLFCDLFLECWWIISGVMYALQNKALSFITPVHRTFEVASG